ncbi:hypothetical protein AYO44_17405 [Planctomycetaceae bacterium SCGC AG-212-F19]|nr:hypothetical protein AYO44_17405 [Planctomycetaceae bacterium SCGC AG-212-F19]
MKNRLKAVVFDLDHASLSSLRQAFPNWEFAVINDATPASLHHDWNPGEVDLLVVQARVEPARTFALCRVLGRRGVFSSTVPNEETEVLGPRGSLQTQAERAHAPLLVLVPSGQADLVLLALEAGAHSCLMLPINAKDVASMLVHARAGNQPGRHTSNLEGAQGEDGSRDDGGQG